jgi:LCP family protein required for cell wall assembly
MNHDHDADIRAALAQMANTVRSEPPAVDLIASTSARRGRTPTTPRSTRTSRTRLRVGTALVFAAALVGGVVIVQQRSGTTRRSTIGSTPSTLGSGATSAVPESFPPADPQAKNFLVVGLDSRPCVAANSPWAGVADPARDSLGTRTDTIMIVRLDPAHHLAAVLSVPRDLWVQIHGGAKQRINTASEKNNPSRLAQTILDNFGITVDHYLQIDFCAFARIVDAVGGVGVPFATPVLDPNVAIDIPAGCHTFRGDEALAYVRSRHLKWIDASGGVHEDRAADYGRIARQQDFLRRVLAKVLHHSLLDPAVTRALITSLQQDIVTDQGFTIDDMMKFAGTLRGLDPKGIGAYQIAATPAQIDGNSVLLPQLTGTDMRAVLAIFQGVDSLPAPADTTGGAAPVVAPSGTPRPNLQGDIVPDPNVEC